MTFGGGERVKEKMYYIIFYTKEYQRYIHYIKTDNIERIEEYLKELLGAKEIKKITDMYYIVDNIDINIYPIEVKELSAEKKEGKENALLKRIN